MKRRAFAVLSVLYALVSVTYSSAQSVRIPIQTRDFDTQFAVQATVEFKGSESQSVETGKDGRASVSLLPGKYKETITAPGYQTLTFDFVVHPSAAGNLPGGAVLEPVKKPEEITAANTQLRPGYTVVSGYVHDENNQPVGDTHLRLQGKEVGPVDTTTNSRGFYLMEVPSPPETPDPHGGPDDTLPGAATLTVKKSGYKTQIYTNILLPSGEPSGVLIAMQRGSGKVETDVAPAWFNGTGGTNVAPDCVEHMEICVGSTTPNHLKPKPDSAQSVSPN